MRALSHIIIAATRARRGCFLLPGEGWVEVRLNPEECALLRLFLAHPEGISSNEIQDCREEFRVLYSKESIFDEIPVQEAVIDSLCGDSKTVFYSLVSRIKMKFVKTVGARRADGYAIKRMSDGIYRTKATLGG